MHRPNSRISLATLLLCGASVTAIFAPMPASAVPAIGLSPASDHPGVKVTVSGSKFGVSEAVDIYFDSTDEILAVTDSRGALAKHSFTVPVDAAPGEHWITAVGRRDGDGAQKLFTVATTWGEHGFKSNGKRSNPWENVISAQNVKKLDTAWSMTASSSVMSSAAVANGVVYVAADDPSFIGTVYAFNAASGNLLWSASTHAFDIVSTPAVANGIVYVGAEDGGMWAFNATTGATVWTNVTGAPGSGIFSSPAVANGIVYVGSSDDKLYAFNASSGALLWSSASGGTFSSPAVATGVVYIGSAGGTLSCVDAATGVGYWRVPISGVSSSPAVANGIVYVGSTDNNLYALTATHGQIVWASQTSGPISSSPAVANGAVYIASDATLYAFDAATGATLWSTPAKRRSRGHKQPFTVSFTSPAVANGVVYAGLGDSLYAFDAVTGATLWGASTGNVIQSSPTVSDGMVFVGSDDSRFYAYAIDGGDNAAFKNHHTLPPSYASLHPDYRLKSLR